MNLPSWMDNRAAEFRYALRMIRKTPGVSAIAVLSLALGIGANTAIFSLIDNILLKFLPVKAPQELYRVGAGTGTSWNYPDYVAFRDQNTCFSGLAAASGGVQPLGMQLADAGPGDITEIAYTTIVSGNYFDVLGVPAALGHVFNPEDDRRPGASPYAVLSYQYWQARFSGDTGVIGRRLRLNGYPFTIIGVARRGFRGTNVTASPNLFIPMMMRSEVTGEPFSIWNDRHYWWMQLVGRLKPGANVKQAQAQLDGVFRDQEAMERKASPNRRNRPPRPIILMPGARGYSWTRERLEKPLVVLMVVVGVVLLIACANVANLMLGRGAARQREMAVRLAIGASRSRLSGQLLIESMLIALAGGAAGLALAFGGVRVLLDLAPPVSAWDQVNVNISPDLRLLGFTFAVSLVTGVLFGIVPALKSTRPDVVTGLKEDAPGSAGSSRLTLRNALVVVQVALSLLLLIGAGLLARTLGNLRDVDLGFRRENTIFVDVDPSRNGYKGQRLRNFYEQLRADAQRLPGVQSVSLTFIPPLAGSRWNNDISIEGYQWKPGDNKVADRNAVSARYFETIGIPMLLGRDFRDEDNPPFSPDPPKTIMEEMNATELPGARVAIISETTAKRFFAGRNPIGLHVCFSEEYKADRAYEIVGVVKDAHYFGLREAIEPMIYVPMWRYRADRARMLCVRTTREAPEIVEMVRRQVMAIDSAVPVLDARTIQQQIDSDILQERLIATLSSFFGSVALLLAGVGLYGVISYAVARRTREIGIRMALGAQRGSVLWLVIRDAAALVAAGAVIGIPAAVAATRLLKTFLYGVSPQDPLSIATATAVLAAVAALAGFMPARRATEVDPNVALRYE